MRARNGRFIHGKNVEFTATTTTNKSNDNFGNCQARSRIAAVKNKAINIGAKTGAIVQREACCRNKPDKHKQIVIL
jgi:hypothetical protein